MKLFGGFGTTISSLSLIFPSSSFWLSLSFFGLAVFLLVQIPFYLSQYSSLDLLTIYLLTLVMMKKTLCLDRKGWRKLKRGCIHVHKPHMLIIYSDDWSRQSELKFSEFSNASSNVEVSYFWLGYKIHLQPHPRVQMKAEDSAISWPNHKAPLWMS